MTDESQNWMEQARDYLEKKEFDLAVAHCDKARSMGYDVAPQILAEIDQALTHHELIKVRINAADREQRTAIIDAICEQTKGEPVQCIGHILLIFRRNPKKRRISLNSAG